MNAHTATDWKAQQMARACAAHAMQAANPHLVAVSAKVDALQAAAKNVRIELARAFPGVKFTVRTSRFSMGNSLSIGWTDGPNADQVDAIADRYSAGSFDGMTDSYTYSRNAWSDAFGEAKYVHTTRTNSERALASALRTVAARFALDLEQLAGRDLCNVYPTEMGGDSVRTLVNRTACRRTWTIAKRLA